MINPLFVRDLLQVLWTVAAVLAVALLVAWWLS